jgi:hypothetical protein
MDKLLETVLKTTLKRMISEAPAQETDNSAADAGDSIFTPAEKKFLGKFDAYGNPHLGVIYSISDIGIREFLARSGKEFNLNPGILLNLLRQEVIKLVPYTGWGRNNEYTIELQLSLDDVKGLGAADKEKIEKGKGGGVEGGAPPPGGPGPEVAWVVKYGDVLRESAIIAQNLLVEGKSKSKSSDKSEKIKKTVKIIDEVPAEYLKDLKKIINRMKNAPKTAAERIDMIIDVIYALQTSLKMKPAEIRKSFDHYKKKKSLQEFIKR